MSSGIGHLGPEEEVNCFRNQSNQYNISQLMKFRTEEINDDKRVFAKSIFELEAIFERSHNNASELERLLNELAFRNTAKARMLTTKVEQALTAVNDCSLVSMPSSTPSELNPNSVFTQSSEVVAHNTPEMTVQLKHKPLQTQTSKLS